MTQYPDIYMIMPAVVRNADFKQAAAATCAFSQLGSVTVQLISASIGPRSTFPFRVTLQSSIIKLSLLFPTPTLTFSA